MTVASADVGTFRTVAACTVLVMLESGDVAFVMTQLTQPTLLAEDLLLLLIDDGSGRPTVDATRLDLALAGAVLLDLVDRGRVDVSGTGEATRAGRLVVRDATPTGDPLLDKAVRQVNAKRPPKPATALPTLAKKLREALLERLTERGVLRAEHRRVLGIFPAHRWPAADSTHEVRLRDGLRDVLVVGRTPSRREAALISLLHAVDQVSATVAGQGVDQRQLKRRAKSIAENDFAGDAVRKAVEAINAALVASITTATVSTSS